VGCIDGTSKFCFHTWTVATRICINRKACTQEIGFDLDKVFTCGSQTLRYFLPVTDILHLKVNWGEV